jgi:replicative DNA helicase
MSIAEQSGGPGSAFAAEPWDPERSGGYSASASGGGGYGADRMPPQDNDAEQSVLGSMLLSKDAIADVIETIRGTDFYRPVHETVFDAMIDLYGRGEPVDPVTTAAELGRRGELVRVGGAPYLHTLSASVPIAANASYYAEIVREKAILRRLVNAGTRIVQMGYAGEGEVDDVVDAAQQEVYSVTDKRTSEDYAPLSAIMEATLDEIEAISNRGGEMTGVPTGFADLDDLTNGLHGGQMVIIAARPAMGKSTLALDFCRAASIHNNLTSVIFSLEMTRNEITMRLLSAEAKIPLNHMRNGNMTDDDWQKLARKMGEVSSAPLFIDDSPNMTMMEIRAKARRLKQRHDLKLIVIDYLQLMTSGKKVESRQLEVSEFSRQIKLLAKELEVPVIALSQLNRGPEQRADKRPMLSDLRESGCLTADTRVMRADTNAETTIGELLASGARDTPVWALDDRLKLVPRTMTHAFPSGVKDVYRLTLASGRTIKATANHPFLTYDGWRPLGELQVGDRLGVVRHVPPPLDIEAREDHEVVSLARGLGGRSTAETYVPDWVFALPKEQVALFLRTLWAADGCVHFPGQGQGRIYCASTSRRLADDVVKLLLRFNVLARVKVARKAGHRDGYQVHVTGAENQLRFLDDIGVHGDRAAHADRLAEHLRSVRANTNVDTIPRQVWDRVKGVLGESQGVTPKQLPASLGTKGSISTMTRVAPSRQRMHRVAQILGDVDLEVLATNDVFWDEVRTIEHLGQQEVYDATVMGVHNFVADGICVKNSIEQDADVVVLLHREDAYEKESTRPGEADLIVAKHRNGPTRDVVVAFQGHYSRFVDMAHG